MCQLACNEMFYDVTVNSAPWPHVSQQLAFYGQYIRGNEDIYGQNFNLAYESILENLTNSPINDLEVLELLNNIDLIENNFIQMNVTPGCLQSVHVDGQTCHDIGFVAVGNRRMPSVYGSASPS